MHHNLTTLLIVSLFTIGLFSCDNTPKETNVTEEKTEILTLPDSPAAKEYLLLKSQVDSSWGALNKIEEEKIFTLKRLLQEISFNPKHKSNRLKEELSKVESLDKQKLNQSALKDLSNMDQFDVLSDSIIASVTSFKEETPNMEGYPLADDLISDLDSLNGNAVISKRGEYGKAVLEYNKYIKTNNKALEELGLKNLEPVPGLFPDEE